MTGDERREMLRNNYAAQMDMLGYQPDGNPKDLVEVVRCKDCEWYDERISMCDNCGLPREQTFFCADGKGGEME